MTQPTAPSRPFNPTVAPLPTHPSLLWDAMPFVSLYTFYWRLISPD